MEISEVGIAHTDVISVLHGACLETAWNKQAVAEILVMPGTFALISASAEQPQGFALVRLAVDEAEIISIGVIPAARRSGHAEGLLRSAISSLTRRGAAKVFLEVAEDNAAACTLYEKCGFSLCGRRKDYYDHKGAKTDALIYALEIIVK